MKKDLNNQLEKEREKLNKLIEHALENNMPIIQDIEIQIQTRKVDELVAESYKPRKKGRNVQKER